MKSSSGLRVRVVAVNNGNPTTDNYFHSGLNARVPSKVTIVSGDDDNGIAWGLRMKQVE